MRKFSSPMGIELGSTPFSAVVVHLLLILAALVLTAGFWAAAAQTSRSHASSLDRLSSDETVQRVTLPPVVVVGHREEIGPGSIAVAAVSTTADCPNVNVQARGWNPFRVNLRQ